MVWVGFGEGFFFMDRFKKTTLRVTCGLRFDHRSSCLMAYLLYSVAKGIPNRVCKFYSIKNEHVFLFGFTSRRLRTTFLIYSTSQSRIYGGHVSRKVVIQSRSRAEHTVSKCLSSSDCSNILNTPLYSISMDIPYRTSTSPSPRFSDPIHPGNLTSRATALEVDAF